MAVSVCSVASYFNQMGVWDMKNTTNIFDDSQRVILDVERLHGKVS